VEIGAPPRWQQPVGHATPVRSPGEVSVADSGGVRLLTDRALACSRATSAPGRWRSRGCSLAIRATAAAACGAAIEVPWMVE